MIVDLTLFHLAFFLRLPPFLSLGDCFFVFSELQVLFSHLCAKEGKKSKEGKRNRKGIKEGRKEEEEKIEGKIRRNFNKN